MTDAASDPKSASDAGAKDKGIAAERTAPGAPEAKSASGEPAAKPASAKGKGGSRGKSGRGRGRRGRGSSSGIRRPNNPNTQRTSRCSG